MGISLVVLKSNCATKEAGGVVDRYNLSLVRK